MEGKTSPKGQKGFAIVNIVMGVILAISGFMMFSDPSTGIGGIIAVAIGIAIWVIGAYALSTYKKYLHDEERVKKAKRLNTICFVISCVVLAAVVILPIVAPML